MKRPGHDLTWRPVHHRCSPTVEQSNNTHNHIDIHYPKSPVVTIPNNITNINGQQSDSVPKTLTSPKSILKNAHNDHHSSTTSYSCETNIIYSELRTIISHLTIITDHIWRQEKFENESQDWKFVAMVVDRLCLILFIISVAIFTTLTFLSASKFYTLQ